MSKPISFERDFWERAALAATPAILLAEKDSTVEEAAAMSAGFADYLAKHWQERFDGKDKP